VKGIGPYLAGEQESHAIARKVVGDYIDANENFAGMEEFDPDDILIVWFSKVLQNWKALVYFTGSPGWYFEVTHDGAKERSYLDVYIKHDNRVINT
jgi:hypothetical protein